MVNNYGYYRELINNVRKGEPFSVMRVNESGSRMSSKTWSSIEGIIIMCLVGLVKADLFRYMKGKDRKELFDQVGAIIESFPGLIQTVEIHKTNMTYTFPNGSVIEVSGLHKQSGDDINLTGKSSSNKFDYQIALAEERYEITDVEWGFVQQALRGAKNYLEIHLANPWIFSNDYVKYCNENLPFDLETLQTKGEQFEVIDKELTLLDGESVEYKEVFHYTNYGVNHFLTTMDKVKLEIASKHDPHRKNTILYGYPGTPEGAIWKWVLPKMKQVPREQSIMYVGGVDYGERNDATTGYIAGFSANNTHCHIEHEYYYANKKNAPNKNTNALAEEVVNHFIDFYEDNITNQSELAIWVDGSAIPFITALNTYCEEIGWSDLIHFYQQTDKKRVADRIETMKTLSSFGLITVDKNCKDLLRELTEQVYSDKSRTSADYVNGDDHGTDAMYYAIATKWVELLENMEYLKQEEAQSVLEREN